MRVRDLRYYRAASPVSALALTLCVALSLSAGCKNSSSSSGSSSSTPSTTTSATTPPAGDTIMVGEYGSITGKEASFGQSSNQGIQLATDELNAAGGINGKKVTIAVEDDLSDATKASTAVKRLIDDKNVIAVLGEVASGSSMAGGQVCQDNKVPMITPSSTKPSVTQVGDYIFRVCFIDPYQSAVVARFAHDCLKAQHVAIFTDNASPYSKGFSDDFKTAFTKMGGQVIAEQSYTGGDKDFHSALTAIKATKADAILVPGYYSDAGSIAKQARELGITQPLLGGDGWDSQSLFDTGGDAVNGCYFSDHMSIDDPKPAVQAFVKAYTDKYKSKPDALSALGYDAARLLFDAMKRAKSLTRSDIKDAIAQTTNFAGVTGDISIDANRNAAKSAVIIAVRDKQFKFQTAVTDPNVALAGCGQLSH